MVAWYNEYMNPELPQVRPTIENAPQIPGSVEYSPEQPQQNSELQKAIESAPSSTPADLQQNIPMTLPVVAPAPTTPTDDGQTSVVADDDTPLVAADDDLIEKEWVDKLKKIVALTRDDPYERNRVITQLQADYLKKRYNKTLGQRVE